MKRKIRKKNFCNRSSCCDWNWRFYFGYDIGRMDHDEERIRAELKKTTADSEISIRPVAKGGTGKTEIET